MKNESIHIFSSNEKLADFFAGIIIESIKKTAGARPFNVALSGGSTPREIFRYLAENYKEKIDWAGVKLFWGDERCVPPTSDESNYKMTSENLIKKINIPASNIYRIEAEKDPEEEAKRYSNQVIRLLPHRMGTPRFDLVMLGLGEDGHTASIFPGWIHLFNSKKLFEVIRHPGTGQIRITATGKLINNAKEVCFLVTGESKAERVAQIIEKKPGWEKLPASLILPDHGKLIWMLDGPAAQMLNLYHASHRRF
jgi:6-phosphogluconolactonase